MTLGGITVYTLTIDHKHGTDTRVFRSEQSALDALAEWARQWWPVEVDRWKLSELTQEQFNVLSAGEQIAAYFDKVSDREFYSLDQATLED
jgi:hypothetical protein